MMAAKRLPVTGILLLAGTYSGAGWAVECLIQRGYAGIEGISSHTSDSLWRFDDPAFRNNTVANLYLSSVGRCTLTESLSIKAQASGEYALQAHQPGTLEDKRHQGLGILNEATASWAATDSLYIDVGKVRKTSGYLFSVAPLDLLRNTSGNMRSVRVFGLGDRWRNFYDEGAYGISSSLYRNEGTYTLAAFPRLKRNDQRQEAASEWDALLRTNSNDRYYASYTATGLKAFNPTFSILAGDQKTLALGTSGNLTDNLILSVEGSLSHGQTWRHLDTASARAMRQLAYVQEPYKIRSNGAQADIGVGLRYTTDDQTEYGAEYYGQSQGYSRSEWKDNFDTIRFVNGGYAKQLPSFLVPGVRDAYQQYSRMMAAETDNVGRAGNLLGKHYLTLYTRTNKEQVGSIDWSVSGMVNLVDGSNAVNLHLSTPLKNNFEVYTGVAASFGSKESEFGTFGDKGNIYAGMRINW
ncbi:hypothetical protein FHU10_4590 [Serratia fonticola]|uniref:Alginate export domain-containing protein n=1 Tax=Serratia fonticola TaxID=47917 RepID=A0A559TBE6_SERFO|nr:hypothetical protein [Serratia fonticola]TQI80539.1 hypothetical protein FHU09_3115 [Serratia fonticola]TQI97436.1 hypothetical protein FHU11_2930 [Serratia fonticola]TVZ71933.1 hypothetical protein FHU10_4590 [Serratia fonticola]